MNLRPRGWKVFSSVGRFFAAVAVGAVICGFLFGAAWCSCVGFSAGDDAVDTLQKAGFVDVELGEPSRYKCSEKDSFSNTFTATNPRGDRVEGVVCCGWGAACMGKVCTIRF